MLADMAPVQNEGDFQRLASQFGMPAAVAGPAQGKGGGTREETVALQALRDLAASFVPERGPLERVVDVVAFAQKMQDILDVFFKCFLPLRDGHKQFQTQMDIKDIKKTRSPTDAMNAARVVETAREPRQLAARVLDWTDPTNEGSRAIESTFAEVMVHQVAMLNGVMRGVRSLLAKLAPASIEAELGNPRRRTSSGMQIGPFRYKTLWDLYSEIYGDFAEDEKQAFKEIFGSEFGDAYAEWMGDAPAPAGGMPAPHAFGQHPPQNQFPQPPQRRTGASVPPGGVQQPPMVGGPPGGHAPPQNQPPNQQPGHPAPPPMVSQPGAPQPPWPGAPWPGGGGGGGQPPRR
jgi:hypothetical protein